MSVTVAGELYGYKAPGAGDTVEVAIVLTDSDGAKVAGVAFDAAGMAVTYRKEGAHSYSAFPTFATENWAECGGGEYDIIMRQSAATELALMDTEGHLNFYVICDATAGDFARVKINSADIFRDDAVEGLVDDVCDEALTGATHNVPTSLGRRLRELEPSAFATWYVDGVAGNDGNDGDSPDAPFLTIGAAIAAVSAGESIVVGPATYAEAGLDLNVASVTMSLARGVIITGGGVGACLVVSAANCIVSGGLYLPGAAEVGIDVEVTADCAMILNTRTSGCSVGFHLKASYCALVNCRSINHSATGFDIEGAYCRLEDCKAQGGGAVRGFYLSGNSADNNIFHDCHSLNNGTAGFEVVAGADNNCFAFSASGDGDGLRVDNGTNNSWAGYAILPLVVPGDIPAMRGTDGAALTGEAETAAASRDAIRTIIAGDVENLDGAAMRGTDGVDTAAMRGTDGAYTGTPPTVGEIDTQLSNVHGAGSWLSGTGAGSKAVSIKLATAGGVPAVGLQVTVKNADQSANIGIATTDSLGVTEIALGLEAATDYVVVVRANVAWTFSATDITTGAGVGDETITVVGTQWTPTPPPAPSYCTVFGFVETPTGAIGEGIARIAAVHSPATRGSGATTVSVVWSNQDTDGLNVAGRFEFALLQGAVIDIVVELTNAADIYRYRLTVPATSSVNWEQMIIAP